MWCLRYWAFLPLLPFPTASPLWQLLYLVSMLAANRTCVYCTALLLSLFMASCFINLSTTTPSIKSIVDQGRCWISLNKGDLFNPLPTMPTGKSTTTTLTNATSINETITHTNEFIWSRLSWLKKSYVVKLGRGDGSGVRIDFGL